MPSQWKRTSRWIDRVTLKAVLRSQLLKVVVFCPHFQRAVNATRNQAIDRLVSCDDSELCRDRAATAAEGNEHARPFPHACPVFPSLAK